MPTGNFPTVIYVPVGNTEFTTQESLSPECTHHALRHTLSLEIAFLVICSLLSKGDLWFSEQQFPKTNTQSKLVNQLQPIIVLLLPNMIYISKSLSEPLLIILHSLLEAADLTQSNERPI